MNNIIKLEGLALDIAGKWADYRAEKARKGEELAKFDRLMKMQITVGVVGSDMFEEGEVAAHVAEEIFEAAIELSDIQIQAYEWATQRKEAIAEGLPMDAYDHSMRKGIFFSNLDDDKTDEIFRLAVKISESEDLQ